MTLVERSTRRFLAWAVTPTRSKQLFESLVDSAPVAHHYFSDAFRVWASSWYPGAYKAMPNKSETYSVEGDNSELRHYLARLVRRSRCYSRSLSALARAVDLFVWAWNARQEFKRQFPRFPAHVFQFLPTIP